MCWTCTEVFRPPMFVPRGHGRSTQGTHIALAAFQGFIIEFFTAPDPTVIDDAFVRLVDEFLLADQRLHPTSERITDSRDVAELTCGGVTDEAVSPRTWPPRTRPW